MFFMKVSEKEENVTPSVLSALVLIPRLLMKPQNIIDKITNGSY